MKKVYVYAATEEQLKSVEKVIGDHYFYGALVQNVSIDINIFWNQTDSRIILDDVSIVVIIGSYFPNLLCPVPLIRILSTDDISKIELIEINSRAHFLNRCQVIIAESLIELESKSGLTSTCFNKIEGQLNEAIWEEALVSAISEFYPIIEDQSLSIRIVTPSFNHACYIEETIKSVLSQNYKNYSYFVSDGGSQDATVEILKKYKDQLSWRSEADHGYADAVNHGFKNTLQDYALWLPSDDLFFDEYSLSRLVRHLRRARSEVIYGEAFYIVGEKLSHPYETREYSDIALKSHCYICQPACLFKLDQFQSIGGLDINLKSVADYDLWLKFTEKGLKFSRISLPISLYRLQEQSITVSQRYLTYKEILQLQLNRYGSVYPDWVFGALIEIVRKETELLLKIFLKPTLASRVSLHLVKQIQAPRLQKWIYEKLINKKRIQKFILKILNWRTKKK